jgi:transposase
LISSKPVSGQPVNSDRSLDTRAFIITNPENAANFCIGRDSGRTSVSTLNTSAIQPAHKVESAGFGEDRARAQAGAEGLGYGTSLWTSARVARLIERECAVEYHPGHVWRILRYLEWSSQRPAGRALERDEVKIQQWEQKRWPEIKKKPETSGGRSSSSTKAD